MPALDDFTGSVAVVVSSCDAFFDAWRPFAAFFHKFWSDCPLDVFIVTNRLNVRSARWRGIAVGEDRGWSSNLLAALGRIGHPYILYFQEDYFLAAPVALEQLGRDFTQAIGTEADSLCFRARTREAPGLQPLDQPFGLVPLASDGRTRCQVTLWKRRALQSILRPGETAWDFEARGSARTRDMQILSYLRRENTPIPYLMSAISRGLWMPDAISLCREHGVEIDPLFRPLHSSRPWHRSLRRALGRSRLQGALRRQESLQIEL